MKSRVFMGCAQKIPLYAALFVICGALSLISGSAHAQDISPNSIHASQEKTFARLSFRIENRPDSAAIISNGVLIVQFAEPVDLNVDPVPGILRDYVSAAKRDPDGMALRFALSKKLTANSIAIGDLLFIDLLPQGWRGFPPPVPPEALTEVTLKARKLTAAEAELKRMRQAPHKPLYVTTGVNPTFYRMVFALSEPLDMAFSRNGNRVNVRINANVPFDPLPVRAALSDDVSNLTAERGNDFVNVSFNVNKDVEVRHFREDNTLIVDIMRPAPAAPTPSKPDNAIPDVLTIPPPAAETAPTPPPAGDLPPVPDPDGKATPKNGAGHSWNSKGATTREKTAYAPGAPGRFGHLSNLFTAKSSVPLVRVAMPPGEKSAPPVKQPPASPLVPTHVEREETTLKLIFDYQLPTPAAAFLRGSILWVVFDDIRVIDTDGLMRDSGGLITHIRQIAIDKGVALALELSEQRLMTLDRESDRWVLSLANTITAPMTPLTLAPRFNDQGMSFLQVTMENLGQVHWLHDPVAGDQLAIVTALPPSRGILRQRDLLELRILPSAHGLVVQPKADDVEITGNGNAVIITRPNGLSLSILAEPRGVVPADPSRTFTPQSGGQQTPYDIQKWTEAQKEPFQQRSNQLLRVAAGATSVNERVSARTELAKFYLAHGQPSDAKAVLDVMRADAPDMKRDPSSVLLYAGTLAHMRRYSDALNEVNMASLSANPVAALWRSVAEAYLGRVGRAREEFRKGEQALSSLPDDIQDVIRMAAVKSAVDSRDFATAQIQLDALETLSPGKDQESRRLLRGRMAEQMGQNGLAYEMYAAVMASKNEEAAAEARLWSTRMRMASGEVNDDEAIAEMESLATGWRGDNVEATALSHLAELYVKKQRWRDAFTAMRTAMMAEPQSEVTRKVQAEMSQMFAQLFLGSGEYEAPATLDSVALFYDFKELTPPGRRGDEMIRLLADRLADVDLLDSAAKLLEYQIDNRLSGAARAQVAARAALLHLMNHNPKAAYAVLQSTRQASLPTDLVRNRLLLEARALSELKRTDLALEMLEGYDGSDVVQLRADILWQAERWQPAAEALELGLGNRWQGSEPLDDTARQNIMRAAIAYVQAQDQLGMERLRAKFSSKMSTSSDARAFDVVTASFDNHGAAFQEISRAVAASDMFEGFLTEYKQRYPDSVPQPIPNKPENPPPPTKVQGS
jgi:hypothetical protein